MPIPVPTPTIAEIAMFSTDMEKYAGLLFWLGFGVVVIILIMWLLKESGLSE
jgi:hypothetical protein